MTTFYLSIAFFVVFANFASHYFAYREGVKRGRDLQWYDDRYGPKRLTQARGPNGRYVKKEKRGLAA